MAQRSVELMISGGFSNKSGIIFISSLTLLHSGRPKLYAILAFLSAVGLKVGSESITRNHNITDYNYARSGCDQSLRHLYYIVLRPITLPYA